MEKIKKMNLKIIKYQRELYALYENHTLHKELEFLCDLFRNPLKFNKSLL